MMSSYSENSEISNRGARARCAGAGSAFVDGGHVAQLNRHSSPEENKDVIGTGDKKRHWDDIEYPGRNKR